MSHNFYASTHIANYLKFYKSMSKQVKEAYEYMLDELYTNEWREKFQR